MEAIFNARAARLRRTAHHAQLVRSSSGPSLDNWRRIFAFLFAWALCCMSASYAATVTRTGNDGFGAAGFNTAQGWSDAAVPTAGNDYVDQNFDLRSPPDANPYIFAGDSLTVSDGGRFLFKGTSGTAAITINNLTLDGGILRNAQGNAWLLAGNLHLTANGGIAWPSSGAGATNISTNIDGVGPLAIGGADSGDQSGQVNSLSGTNTFVGPLLLLGGTVTLTGPGALPSGAILKFGSATPNANSGRATLNLNGGNYTVGGLSVASFTAVTATGGTYPAAANNGAKVVIHYPRLPAGIQIGQLVNNGGSVAYVVGIDYSTNDILLGESSQITPGNDPTGTLTFQATAPSTTQVITNNNTTTPGTLNFAGGLVASVFDGVINQAAGASTSLKVSSGSLTLQCASGYTGATNLSGGTLNLNFNSAGSPATNVINVASPLVLDGGALALNSTTSTTTTANLQTFGNTTVSGSSSLQLTANTQPSNGPRNSIALNLGAITRTNGTVDVTNPLGTLSATNGVLTTSGTASQVLTDGTGAAFATIGQTEWAAKDASNAFLVPFSTVGSYTNSTATTLSGHADVVTDVALAGPTTISTLRFNSGSRTVSGGTLSTGGILMTPGSGASAISGGTLQGTSGGNLTIIQHNTASNLSISSSIADNGSATALNKAGAGTAVLSGTNNYTGATNVLGGTLQFAKQVSLYNNNSGSWSNINVANGATLAVNVGGGLEFTPNDVGTLAGLSGFQSGSALGIDTANAGGTITLSSPISNPNVGANAIGITKLGSGVLIAGATNTYTGATTVNGGTLRLGSAGSGSISSSSPVVLGNVAGATFDLNNNATTLKSVSGGGTTGGTLALGSGNLTISGGTTASFAGGIAGTGSVTVTNASNQSFTGTPAYTGGTTINVGSLLLSSSSSSSVGSSSAEVVVAPGSRDIGNLTVGSGVTLNANNLLVGSVDTSATVGGAGRVTMTGGSIVANNVFLASSGTLSNPAQGSLTLSGGTLTTPAVTTVAATIGQAAINFDGGTLCATAASNPGNFIDTNIATRVAGGGATIDTNGNTFTLSNNFVHDTTGPATDGGFTKTGNGTLSLFGTNTYTGRTVVTGGTLQIGTANAASSGYGVNGASSVLDVTSLGTFSLGAGQSLQGTGAVLASSTSLTTGTITGGISGVANSMGTLTFSNSAGGNLDLAGGIVRFDLSNSAAGTNDKIAANGGLTASVSSVIDVEFASLPTTAQTYRLFDYAGSSVSGSAANFVLAGNGGRGVTLNFATLGQVNLAFVPGNPSATLIWNATGAAPQNWDIQTTLNWNNSTQAILHDKFFNGDNVTFDNTVGVQTTVSIPNGVSVAPGSITVNSNTNNFAISSPGTGKITGATGLVKSGSSTLTLATSNDYQGGTTINSGTVVAKDVGSVGSASATGSGPVTVAASATLQIGDGVTSGAGTVTGPVHNSGSVDINRPDGVTLTTAIDGTGGVTIQGGGTVTASGGGLSYSGNTNIANGTLTANAVNVLSPTSVVVLSNVASSVLDFGGNSQIIGGLSGGGPIGGTVNILSGNVTFGGSTTNTFAGAFNMGNGTITVDGAGVVQNLTGGVTFSGPTTVRNGTLSFSPSADTTLGATGAAVTVGTGLNNSGTLAVVGPHATLLASTLTVGSNDTTNAIGTVTQTGGTIQSNGAVNLGNNGGNGTLNLSGGTFNIGGQLNMATNNAGSSATVIVGAGEQVNLVNNNIQIGAFFNPPSTITLNGGSFNMVLDTLSFTPNAAGRIIFQNNNAQNLGTYTVNLNGGVLSVGGMNVNVTADSSGVSNFNLNRRPTINFNGGTLRATGDNSDFFSPTGAGGFTATIAGGGNPIATNMLEGGGTIDTAGHLVGVSTTFAHGGTAAIDGGLTVTDSSGVNTGVLTFNAANTYTGPTKVASGTLQMGIANAIPSTSNIHMSGGTLSLNSFGQQAGGLKTTATSIIDMTTGNTGEILQLADSTALHWVDGTTATGATLHIANWTGNATTGGGLDQILLPSVTSLTGNQLNQIVFDGSGFTHAKLIAVGGGAELVPTNTAPTGILQFADINQDGNVNAADIPAFLTALTDLNKYKTQRGFNDVQMITVADINFDDVVTNVDIQSLLDLVIARGGTGAAVGVPEPSTWMLLAIGALLAGMLRRQRNTVRC